MIGPMRYRLRTLMIVLARGPPILAWSWWHPFWLPCVAVGVLMGTAFAAWDEWITKTMLAKRGPQYRSPTE
jgi:hypothetical protein